MACYKAISQGDYDGLNNKISPTEKGANLEQGIIASVSNWVDGLSQQFPCKYATIGSKVKRMNEWKKKTLKNFLIINFILRYALVIVSVGV